MASAATSSSGTTTLKGTLSGPRRKAFTVQLFSNPSAGDEGKTFLGEKQVKTNRKGKASFTFTLASPVAVDDTITATATGPSGTSEFSDPVEVTQG